VALIAAAATGAVSVATADSAGRGGDCGATTRPTAHPQVLAFRLGYCEGGFEFGRLTIDPTVRIDRIQRRLTLRGGRPGDRYRCRLKANGARASCDGQISGRGSVSGTFRFEGQLCGVSVHFSSSGGVRCSRGEVCPDIAIALDADAPRPAGC